jgi:hypothetical protein
LSFWELPLLKVRFPRRLLLGNLVDKDRGL